MALGSIFMCVSTAARADYIPPCSPSDSNVKVLPFPGGIATSLLKLLTEHVGDIESPGEEFDATDIRQSAMASTLFPATSAAPSLRFY
jgi:hypothetical protein